MRKFGWGDALKLGLKVATGFRNKKWSWGNLLKGGLSALNSAVNDRLAKATWNVVLKHRFSLL
jgi:hypothetical protein